MCGAIDVTPLQSVYKVCIECVQKNTMTRFRVLLVAILSLSTYYARMKRNYQPKKRKRMKTHGFRIRLKSSTGRRILMRRRRKGRARLGL